MFCLSYMYSIYKKAIVTVPDFATFYRNNSFNNAFEPDCMFFLKNTVLVHMQNL